MKTAHAFEGWDADKCIMLRELVGADCAYVLTLSTRPDRLQKFRQQRFGTDIEELVQEPHPRGGTVGCFEAQRQAWQAAEDRGAGAALVMEDDAAWTATGLDMAARLSTCAKVRELQARCPTWDIIALGGVALTWFNGVTPSAVEGIWECKFYELHAYLISAPFRRRMLQEPFQLALDAAVARYASRSFIVVPDLVYQDPACGTNNNLNVLANVFRQKFKTVQTSVARAAKTLSVKVGGRHDNIPPIHLSTALLIALALSLSFSRGKARAVLAVVLVLCFAFHLLNVSLDPIMLRYNPQH